jgi:hypothetical protein
MHFSYTIQKYLNLKTYVPPHPENDRSLWGSLKGEKYGGGMVSLWQGNPHIQLDATTIKSNHQLMNEYYVKQCKKDWKLVKDKS